MPVPVNNNVAFFQLIADISTSFVLSPATEVDTAVNDALARIGTFFDADRSYVFQFNAAISHADNTHEWCAPGIIAQQAMLQQLSVTTFGGWMSALQSGKAVQINDISQLDANSAEYQLLAAQGIQSVLMLPLLAQNSLLGMFGLDIVHNKQRWTEEQVAALSLIAGNISGSFLRQRAEQQITQLAFFDQLTQLPNRRLILDRLQQALANSKRNNCFGAVLFIDLDNFKHFNDSHGFEQGDELLKHVGSAIQNVLREGDTVGRFAADEFVLILEQLASSSLEAVDAVKVVAKKLMQAVTQQYQRQHIRYHNSVSIGVSIFTGYQQSPDMLITQADMAMYQAKAAGRNCIYFFDPTMQQKASQRTELDNELRQAINEQQFELFYQLQVGRAGQALGAEALIRWRHPTRGLVGPDNFIGFAEESGLIVAIGNWVLLSACKQLRRWQQQGLTADLSVAVNISASQFRQPDFVNTVQQILQQTGANPAKLKLELTESLLITDINDVVDKIQQLAATGIGFALDDFGTGYSSLAYLKRLPLTQLKIDRSFVRDILTDSNDEAIARMIVALGNTLGLEVLAEGIETPSQFVALQQLGCYQYQGYLFGKPLPVAEFNAALLSLPTPAS
ncbi:diguanylate cyclase [Arsukibacterium ikkense]|uniref:cyclic-guanylate-specific phosphodiesterase n=1 Tax=Arsukibacterium ikkense TaxID=336831 RepID=A0A0M2V3C0_9GAMM|nr:EAL domain-containing protein [Arsukibacterium ikkense]KKO45352.1 diguanylate cyclase [Arsukibacterium ikkense]